MIGPIYAITDPDAPLPLAAQAMAAARGGAWAVQVRDKRASDADLVNLARDLLALLRPMGVKLIINDRLDVACAVDADGLHIGQCDGDPAQARAPGPSQAAGPVDRDACAMCGRAELC